MAALTNLTHLLSQVFTSHFVFPVLGHDDPEVSVTQENPYQNLSVLWKWRSSIRGIRYLRKRAEAEKTQTGSAHHEPVYQKCTRVRSGWPMGMVGDSPSKVEAASRNSVPDGPHSSPVVDERVGSPPKPSMSSYHNTSCLSSGSTQTSSQGSSSGICTPTSSGSRTANSQVTDLLERIVVRLELRGASGASRGVSGRDYITFMYQDDKDIN
ncbi:hypothetical protein J6590_077048 [Homalodisca vitripennis]|nr:hypothetical protein J6590_077048 [Homalodisca vitripennis]